MNGLNAANMSQGAQAPAYTIASGVERMMRANNRAVDIRDGLKAILDRLEVAAPATAEGKGGQIAQIAGLVTQLHSHHDSLSERMDEIWNLVCRIERAVGVSG